MRLKMLAFPILPKPLTGWVGCLAVMLLLAPAALRAQVIIDLQPEARVNHRTLRLGDVAVIQGKSARSIDWNRIDLAQLTAVSNQVPISAQTIQFRLLLAGMDPHDFRMTGSTRCLVTLDKCELIQEDVADAIRADLAKKRGIPPEKLEIELIRMGELPRRRFHAADELSLAVWEMEARPATPRVDPNGPPTPREFAIRVLARGREEAIIEAIALVQRWEIVHQTTRDLPAGTALGVADAVRARRLVPLEWQPPAGNDSTWYEGKTALRALAVGQWLQPSDLSSTKTVKESPILIKQKDLVKITARVGGFLIHTNGEAMQDGRQGDLIRVRNLDSKSVILTRVQDKGAVQLEY